MNDKVTPETATEEFKASLERLNMFYQVHDLNKEVLKHVSKLLEEINKPGVEAISAPYMNNWLQAMGDRVQTVDGLMHICQDQMVGVAKEWLANSTDEEQVAMRDRINTPVLEKMDKILTESEEERTQRLLLEMLGIHE